LIARLIRGGRCSCGGRSVSSDSKLMKLVAILLQNRRREGLPAHHEHGLAVFLQLVHQRNEVAVAADDGEGIDVRVRKRHLQRVQSEVDIRPVLIAARRGDALYHLYGVSAIWRVAPSWRPQFAYANFATISPRSFKASSASPRQIRGAASISNPISDVVVIDEHRDVQFVLH